MNKEIEKLESMIGKTVMYRTNNHKILSYKQDGQRTTVVTDKKWFDFQNGELGKFLGEVRDVADETGMVVVKNMHPSTIEAIRDLKSILLENIERVRKDKNYVQQANSVNQSSKSIIELAKTEIEMLKLMKG